MSKEIAALEKSYMGFEPTFILAWLNNRRSSALRYSSHTVYLGHHPPDHYLDAH